MNRLGLIGVNPTDDVNFTQPRRIRRAFFVSGSGQRIVNVMQGRVCDSQNGIAIVFDGFDNLQPLSRFSSLGFLLLQERD